MLYNKIEVYNPSNRYSIDVDNNHTNIQNTWHNLWCIKNPTLRAIRLKILYKDVWSNERRHRMGITSNSDCVICGEKRQYYTNYFNAVMQVVCGSYFTN